MSEKMFQAGGVGEVPDKWAHHPRVRASSFGDFDQSPAHWESFHILGEKTETRAMEMGTAIHMALLEPDRFDETYCEDIAKGPEWIVTVEDLKRNLDALNVLYKSNTTKAALKELLIDAWPQSAKFMYDDVRAMHIEGRQVLTAKEFHACQRIKGRVQANSRLAWLLRDGVAEQQGWAFHELSQTVVTFRPDYVRRLPQPFQGYRYAVTDVKKFRAVDKRSFERSLWESKVFIQAAVYRDAIEATTGERAMFAWLAVDEAAPYTTMGYIAEEPMLEAGRQCYQKALLGIEECRKTGKWPVYSEDLQRVTLPQYAWDQLEYREDVP